MSLIPQKYITTPGWTDYGRCKCSCHRTGASHVRACCTATRREDTIQFGHKECPGCGKSLDGGMIPVELRKTYRADRYSTLRQVFDSHGDGLDYLECPDCGERILA